ESASSQPAGISRRKGGCMLEFLWPGSGKASGEPVGSDPTSAGRLPEIEEEFEAESASETGVLPAERSRADGGGAGGLAASDTRPEEASGGEADRNPLAPPGGPAEFTDQAEKEQDQVATVFAAPRSCIAGP